MSGEYATVQVRHSEQKESEKLCIDFVEKYAEPPQSYLYCTGTVQET